MTRPSLVWIATWLPARTTGWVNRSWSAGGLASTRWPAAGELADRKVWASAWIGAAISKPSASASGTKRQGLNRTARMAAVTAVTLKQRQRLLVDEVRRHLSQMDDPDRPI